jgi:hypothetical protein
MVMKWILRAGSALVVVGCLVVAIAWAQTATAPGRSQTVAQRSPSDPDIQYGAVPIPLPSLQRPPSPTGAPAGGGQQGAPAGGAPQPGAGGPQPGAGAGGAQAGGPPRPKPAPDGGAAPPGGAPQGGGAPPPGPPGGTGQAGGPAPAGGCEPHSPLPPGQATLATAAYQQFPPSGQMKTAWFVTFDHAVHRGLFITSAHFKPGPDKPWIKVLSEAGPSEIFVPYRSGQPRYRDLSPPELGGAGRFGLMPADRQDAGRCGQIIGRNGAVVREVVEKGVLWKLQLRAQKGYRSFGYRGHKMTLWGTLLSGNYNYMISYAFHDDGMIEFRAGATATNLPDSPFEAHMHNVIWRVNVDLNGAQNTVHVIRHIENTNGPTWQDREEPYNNNREGGIEWNPREFTMLHVQAANLRNGRNRPTAYMIMPFFRGTARHQESWMRKDIWVTRYKPQEIYFPSIERYANGEPINNSDVVVWINSSALHIARSEDGRIRRTPSGQQVFIGAAVTMWSGFDMKPNNLFDDTPFIQDVVPIVGKLPPVGN